MTATARGAASLPGTLLQRGLALWLCWALAGAAAALEGRVTRVVDGDSLWLAPAGGGAPLEVRLKDIDAPETCQPWGPQARDALHELVLNKPVRAEVSGLDSHGRTLARLYLDALDVNQWLVKEGHAWSTRFRHDRGRYVSEERMARALGRGLNRAGGAVPPWEFRRDHGPCQTGEAPPVAVPAPAPAPTFAPAPAQAQAQAQAPAGAYRCDGRVYCSQMSSCAEATFFLRNCPGVKMDGDRNGIPCEQQWCRR